MTQSHIPISLRRLNKINPISIVDYQLTNGFKALESTFKFTPRDIIDFIKKSGLRGRGGAGFPTGLKQGFTEASCKPCATRYVVCNADEGEPGTFKDRMIMETDPFLLLEGMIISAYAIGAGQGYIYIRGEYTQSIKNLEAVIEAAYAHGFLGKNILSSGFDFDVQISLGAGSYLCGEELTLLESLEGKRGYPRIKPPFPAEKGLWQKPTLVNNVETFSHIPFIIEKGFEAYAQIGTNESKGTKLFCVSGRVNKTGVYELPFGITLRQLVYNNCEGMQDGYQFIGALMGGAAGTFVDDSFLDVPISYETYKKHDATIGSGAVIIMDDKTDLHLLLKRILSFFKYESCGKCVPCRIGTHILNDIIQKEKLDAHDLESLLNESLFMAKTSLCPLGQSPILPVKSFLKYFKNRL